jgi:uncharacterized membrane protein YkoI
MKSNLCLSLAAAIAVSVGAQGALAANAPASNATASNLESQVKISKMQARQLALDRSPEGTVKSERLEQRGNERVWVVDVSRYREPKHVTTILVDADTGKVESGKPHASKK